MKNRPIENKRNVCLGLFAFTMALLHCAAAQTPIDASDGIKFGTGTDDPLLKKDDTNSDLEVDLADGAALSVYSGSNGWATFLAGEGNEASVTTGKWYRIAQSNTANRANAVFSLRDDIGGGGHSTAVFRAGMSYNDASSMGFTLLSHSYFSQPTFTKIRILKTGTYGTFYLEAYVNKTGTVRYSISDNLSNAGWTPIDWVETTAIPDGYISCEYDIDKLFVVGQSSNILSVDYDGTVAIDGTLKLQDSPVITEAAAQSLLVLRSASNAGSSDSLLMTGMVGGTGAIPVEGAGTRMMWYPEMAAFRAGSVIATQWDEANVGGYSAAFGQDTLAYGGWSVAMGHGAQAIGDRSLAVGDSSTIASGISSVALGDYSKAQGDRSLAIGGGNANGLMSIAHGASMAYGTWSFASGLFNVVDGVGGFGRGVGLDLDATASWSTSFGFFNDVYGSNSFSAGSNLSIFTYMETVLGCYNQFSISTNASVWVYDDPLFAIGNGTSGSDLSNAIVTLKNGKTTLTNKQWLAAWDQDPASALDDPGPADDDSDGDALIVEGHARFKGKVIIDEPQGDISMGIYE